MAWALGSARAGPRRRSSSVLQTLVPTVANDSRRTGYCRVPESSWIRLLEYGRLSKTSNKQAQQAKKRGRRRRDHARSRKREPLLSSSSWRDGGTARLSCEKISQRALVEITLINRPPRRHARPSRHQSRNCTRLISDTTMNSAMKQLAAERAARNGSALPRLHGSAGLSPLDLP